jgi:ATPase subunit of ABC transporter with duplicated ATPase domains
MKEAINDSLIPKQKSSINFNFCKKIFSNFNKMEKRHDVNIRNKLEIEDDTLKILFSGQKNAGKTTFLKVIEQHLEKKYEEREIEQYKSILIQTVKGILQKILKNSTEECLVPFKLLSEKKEICEEGFEKLRELLYIETFKKYRSNATLTETEF